MAAFAAASISGGGQFQTGVQAFRFGWIAYFLPFLFIYKPALLMIGTWQDIAYVFISAVVALILVSGGLIGFARVRLGSASRVLWVVTGLLIIAPLHEFGPVGLEFAVSVFGAAVLGAYYWVARATAA